MKYFRGAKIMKKTEQYRSSLTFVVTAMSLATFTDIYLYSTIVPVVPFAFTSLYGIPESDVQRWISVALAVYSAGLIVGALFFGFLTDKLKQRKTIMLVGLIILLAATFMLCFARTIALYVVGRLLQGISGGLVWTVGLAIISDIAPPEKLGFLMSFPSISVTLGIVLGPLIGGVVYNRAGYYAVYYVCFAILFFDIVFRLLMVERPRVETARNSTNDLALPQEQPQEEDINNINDVTENGNQNINQNESTAAQLEHDIANPPSTATSPIRSVLSNGSASTNTYSEKRVSGRTCKVPLPASLKLLWNLRFFMTMLQTMVLAWLMTALDATLSLHLNDIFGFNSLQSGCVFLAIGGVSLVEPLIGKMVDRYGIKWPLIIGFIVMSPGFILLRIPKHDNVTDIALFIFFIIICGFGMAFIQTPAMTEMTFVVSEEEAKDPGSMGPGRGFGQAYAFFNVFFALGSLIGPFHAGGIRTKYGWARETLSLGIIGIVLAFLSYLFAGENLLITHYKVLKKRQNLRRRKENVQSSENFRVVVDDDAALSKDA